MINFWKKLKKPITALAPMDDVTDFVFREIIAGIAKPDVLFTEFTSADGLFSSGSEKVMRRLLFSEIQRPIVAQIWGSNPENSKKAAKLIENLGFDGIDINMGCPDRSIMSKNSGAALINNKELVKEIIDATRKGSSKLPVSIKTRLDKNRELTREWIIFLLSQNIDALILHGRSAKAMSKGEADWEEIGRAVELRDKINPEIILIGNGDVKSYKEVEEKHKNYKVDGVMIGRGVFNNPWIFERDKEPKEHTKDEYINLLITHTRFFNDKWGEDKNFHEMKKFFKNYIKGFKGANILRQRLMKVKNYEEFCEIINLRQGKRII